MQSKTYIMEGNERYGATRDHGYDMQRNVRASFDPTNPMPVTENDHNRKDSSSNFDRYSKPEVDPLVDQLRGIRDETMTDKHKPTRPNAFGQPIKLQKG